jgi:gamma-glutamylcyclotransferase
MHLEWRRFPGFLELREELRNRPCIYLQTDPEERVLRVGESDDLWNRYRGGTAYAVEAAMHGSGNLLFAALAPADQAEWRDLEATLIYDLQPRYNNQHIGAPPARRLEYLHEGEVPRTLRATSMNKILYFAYGSNMLSRRLLAPDRAPSAIAVGTGFVAGRRLTFDKVSTDGSGKCDAERTSSPTDRVYGVLYEIDPVEKPSLDRAEGLGAGYREEPVTVVAGSDTRDATTYVAMAKEPALTPYHWYKALVVAGAVEHGLPAVYVEWLRTCASQPDPNARRRAENEAVLFSAEPQAPADDTERRG